MSIAAWWLIVVQCFVHHPCQDRLYPRPIPGFQACVMTAAMLIRQRGNGVVQWRLCTRRKPDLPLMVGPVNLERFA